jgi:predicted aspartyl protease
MGLVYTNCEIANPARETKTVAVPRLMVDTGAEATWVDAALLKKIGIGPRKKDVQYQMANGQIISRSVGYAVLKVNRAETVDEVVFAEAGDLQLLGARALEGLNLKVDTRSKKLVAAGPIVVAVAVRPRLGELVRVPAALPKSRRVKKTKPPTRQIRPKSQAK